MEGEVCQMADKKNCKKNDPERSRRKTYSIRNTAFMAVPLWESSKALLISLKG